MHRHMCHFSPVVSPTCRRMRECGSIYGDDAPPAASPVADLSPCHLASPLWCRKMPFFPIFSSTIGFRAFLSPESSPFSVFQRSTTHSGPWEFFVTSKSTGLLIRSIFY